MKKLILLICAFFVCSSVAFAKAAINQPAPDFTLTSSQGDSVKLSDYKGKTVILEWTNHLCPYVQKHYDSNNMQTLQKQYTEKDVIWLSIISSAQRKQGYVTADEANTLTQQRNATPTAVLFDPDGTVGKAYNAKTTPHMYIIDAKGILKYQGAIDSIKSTNQADIPKAENYLMTAMNALEKGEKIPRPVTAAYGCSVKYK